MQNKSIYGAWISKQGDFIAVVEEECHVEIALRDILKAKKEPRKHTTTKIMLRLGYVRIVFDSRTGGHIAEYNLRHGGKSPQKSWIKQANRVDVW